MSYEPKPIDLVLPLNKIKEISQAIDLFNHDWLQYHKSAEDLKLYHYTTGVGLKGILDSRSIWCSHIRYFSDPQEWVYGQSKVISKIEEILQIEKDINIKRLLEDLIMLIRSLTNSFYDVYAACFCEKDNLLSQWRGYSNKGGGYSLGLIFDSNTKFTYDFKNLPDLKLAALRKIIYNVDIQNLLINNALERLIDAGRTAIRNILKTKNDLPIGFVQQMAMGFANRLAEVIVSIKDSVFQEEKEWRLIIFKSRVLDIKSQREIEFWEKRGMLVPYLSTTLYNKEKDETMFPLNSIRVGPGLDSERAKYSLNLLKQKHLTSDSVIKINKDIEICDAGYELRG
jgi:hypothetical protein